MGEELKASIISIGNEIVSGKIQNTHGKTISRMSAQCGISVSTIMSVADIESDIASALKYCVPWSDYIFLTGGLGPTSDDITRESVARFFDLSLDYDESVWESIVESYPTVKRAESNKKQAMVPAGFKALQNLFGTAPGLQGTIGNKTIFLLPGPPGELREMIDRWVFPFLSEKINVSLPVSKAITCHMIPESVLEDFLLNLNERDISWNTQARMGTIYLTLFASAHEQLLSIEDELCKKFGRFRLVPGHEAIWDTLAVKLVEKSVTVATAESCSGGLISKYLTDIAGSSNYFNGGFVTYSNESKTNLLDVSENKIATNGAVSKEVVESMADAAKMRLASDVAIAVSGIAGPGGGSDEKPVGTVWISIAGKDNKKLTECFLFSGNREWVRQKTAIMAGIMLHAFIENDSLLDRDKMKHYI